MREYLFRGWSPDTKQWVYGDLVHIADYNVGIITADGEGPYFVEMDSVGQWTGMMDVDNRKIFEGDIIRACYAENFEGRKGAIFYSKQYGRYYPVPLGFGRGAVTSLTEERAFLVKVVDSMTERIKRSGEVKLGFVTSID